MLENFKNYYKTDSSGVYALYLKENGSLDIFGNEISHIISNKMKDRLLYIGETSCLSRRIMNQHLKRARTSTLRKTIAKLLNMNFVIVSGRKGLTPENEKIISDWLNNNTYFKIYETPTKVDAQLLEDKLIKTYEPPLNKEGCAEHF